MEIAKVKEPARKNKTPVINELAPRLPARIAIVGASGSGKTNMALDLIERYLPWHNLLIYARHLDSPAYQALREKIERREEKLKRPISIWEDSLSNVVPLEELNPSNTTVAVFDDFITSKDQTPIIDYFIRGRHRGVTPVYISQSYYDIPKIIRGQLSHVCIYRGYSGHDVIGLWKDHGSGMRRDEFERFLRDATRRPYGFAVIDNNPVLPELRWRVGWDQLVIPDDDEQTHDAPAPTLKKKATPAS